MKLTMNGFGAKVSIPLLAAGLVFWAMPGNAQPIRSELKAASTRSAIPLALNGLLSIRCHKYAQGAALLELDCQRAAWMMVQALDFDLTLEFSGEGAIGGAQKTSRGVAAFSTKLRALLRNPEAMNYVASLRDLLVKNPEGTLRGNLWDWTLRQARGDSDKALEWISVLLQDTSKMSHVAWARGVDPAVQNQLQLLEDVCARINHRVDFALYPAEVTGIQSRAQYHYYVMAYLSRGLNKGPLRPRTSAVIPFVFNAIYGFYAHHMVVADEIYALVTPVGDWTSISSTGLLEILKSLPAQSGLLALDPEPFGADQWKDEQEDIYLGYVGALWGAGLPNRLGNFDAFSRAFSRNPSAFMKQAFIEMANPK